MKSCITLGTKFSKSSITTTTGGQPAAGTDLPSVDLLFLGDEA